ncbi:MAG: hypothetical protein QM541_07345 [Flavobacterium sp.]|nr:hypothetical protein [Flavobacterium sp.]
MQVHSFLSRVALLCNVLFLYCWYLQDASTNFINNKDVNATILVLGYIVSPCLNVLLSFWWLIMFITKKQATAPSWLLRLNLVIFLFQIVTVMMKA